jgi:hypothetical protein
MDGLQVLKGGLSKATVYFETKEATKNALDLNEQEIVIGIESYTPVVTKPETVEEIVEEIEGRLSNAMSDVALYTGKLIAMARKPAPEPTLFSDEKGNP